MPRLSRGGANLGRRTINASRHNRQETSVLTTDEEYTQRFRQNLEELAYQKCKVCKRLDIRKRNIVSTDNYICSSCLKNPVKFSASNNMQPSIIPIELQDLSVIEQMLIARIQPVMRVYQLKAFGSFGQYHYKGHVINVEQDITDVATSLPVVPSLLGIVIVRRAGITGYSDFRVRKQKVLRALRWLQTHNPYYADIHIDMDAIESLPLDDNVSDQLRYIEQGGLSDESLEEDHIEESAVPQAPRQSQESVIVNQIKWPRASPVPINEFTHSGYIPQAFPHLFPNGTADFLDPTRSINVSFREWCEFLMRYEDKRFSQDPRFRFFCLNTMQRHDACRQSAIFAKKNDFSGNVEQLAAEIDRNPSIIKRLLTWGSKIRGTSSFWYQRRLELQSMVNQLGVPTLFLTLSAADLWWNCLVRHFGISDEELNQLTEKKASQLMQQKLSENPLIADEYFSKRVCIFMDILKEKLKITDFWWRFEYQHRGSPHVHAVLWLENAPDVRTFDSASIDDLAAYKAYYDGIVSAYNPGIDVPRAEKHPSSVWATDVVLGDPTDVAQLLNRVQRHTQHSVYCLKEVSHRQECRFKFPKPKLLDSTLTQDEQGVWQYKAKRNDELLNDHNLFVSQLWRANTDCKIIASEHAIVNYISKYATKGEPQSQDFRTMFTDIMASCTPNDQAKKAFTKMLTKVIGQRDISACEVMHLLTGDPLYHSSRQFVKLYISTDDYVAIANTDTDEFIPRSIMDHYAMRPATQEQMTLCEFATMHKIARGRLITHRKSRVLQLRPVVKPGVNEENDEIYYKQKSLMNIAWRNYESLKTHATWKESFTSRNIPLWELPDNEEVEVERVTLPEEDFHDWQELARTLPNQAPQDVVLGYRDIDREYDGFGTFEKYPGLEGNLDFIKQQKETYVSNTNTYTNLLLPNEDQQRILDHLARQLANNSSEKLTLVQGAAGTGKSFIIHQMVNMIESLHGRSSALLMAPTGVAANNINGQTIHTALRIVQTRGGIVSDLSGEAERQIQEDFRKVKVIICDEMSMVGTRMLSTIDKRLRQAYPNNQELPFGGCIVYLFGDFNQLPPVLDRSLLAPADARNVTSVEGRFLFEQFVTVFELKQVMRQIGDDQRRFRETLERMALGQLTLTDYELLKTRFASNNVATIKSFSSSIRIKAKKDDVQQYNEQMLRSLNKPVALIKALHNNATASCASDDEAQGLHAILQLSQGCRVILRQNLWTSQGLCNGTMGTVVDIIYGLNRSRPTSYLDEFPICVLVHFDEYQGPTFNGSLPILPHTVGYCKKNVSCTRKQFPLQVAYGITVHKAQGITVDKAVVDIGSSEFALGLTYVAISRVRSIEGLIIEPGFAQDRLLKSINNNAGWTTKRRELARLRSLIQP